MYKNGRKVGKESEEDRRKRLKKEKEKDKKKKLLNRRKNKKDKDRKGKNEKRRHNFNKRKGKNKTTKKYGTNKGQERNSISNNEGMYKDFNRNDDVPYPDVQNKQEDEEEKEDFIDRMKNRVEKVKKGAKKAWKWFRRLRYTGMAMSVLSTFAVPILIAVFLFFFVIAPLMTIILPAGAYVALGGDYENTEQVDIDKEKDKKEEKKESGGDGEGVIDAKASKECKKGSKWPAEEKTEEVEKDKEKDKKEEKKDSGGDGEGVIDAKSDKEFKKGSKWPAEAKVVTSLPGNRTSPGGIGTTDHKGVDIAQYGQARGMKVFSYQSGEIQETVEGCVEGDTGCGGGYGNHVKVQHSDKYLTLYAHMQKVTVKKGDKVTAGD